MVKKLISLALLLISLMPVISWAKDNPSQDRQAKPKLQVQVNDINDDLKENVKERLKAEFSRLPQHNAETIKEWYNTSNDIVKQALKPFGYFKPQIKQQGLQHKNNEWQVAYDIKKGPPLKINTLHIKIIGQGHQNSTLRHNVKELSLQEGQRFQVDNYSDAKNRLLSVAQHQGYIKAKVVHDQIDIDLAQYTCKVAITINTGQQYFFGDVSFAKSPLNNTFLKRYVDFDKGDPFNSETLMTLQDNLGGSGYFKSVQVDPKIDKVDRDKQVPIDIDLHPNKRRRYRVGLGYGSVSGVRARAGTDWRWVNRYGHKLNADLTWPSVTRNIETHYIIPGRHPTREQYILNAGLYTLHPHGGRSQVMKVGGKYQSQYGKWQYHYGADYSYERFKTDIHPSYQHSHLVVPNVGLGWMSTQKPINIDQGARFHVLLRGTGGALSSSTEFLQTKIRGKALETIWNNNRFLVRGQLGYTWIDELDSLPLSYQFYTGGPNSVRGYDSQSIGPGRYLGELSGEYQRRVYGNWYAAAFYDAGAAVEKFNEIDNQLKRSVGLGVVWQSPVGDVQIYLAHPIDQERFVSLQVNLGPAL